MLEFCAKSELHPRSGLGMLKGRYIGFAKVNGDEERKVYHKPLRPSSSELRRTGKAGRHVDVFLGLKPPAESYCPFLLRHPEVWRTGRDRNLNGNAQIPLDSPML